MSKEGSAASIGQGSKGSIGQGSKASLGQQGSKGSIGQQASQSMVQGSQQSMAQPSMAQQSMAQSSKAGVQPSTQASRSSVQPSMSQSSKVQGSQASMQPSVAKSQSSAQPSAKASSAQMKPSNTQMQQSGGQGQAGGVFVHTEVNGPIAILRLTKSLRAARCKPAPYGCPAPWPPCPRCPRSVCCDTPPNVLGTCPARALLPGTPDPLWCQPCCNPCPHVSPAHSAVPYLPNMYGPAIYNNDDPDADTGCGRRRERRWPQCNFIKPCLDTRVFRNGEHLALSYSGHIPGERFIYGRNLPTSTTFAKRRLCTYTPYEFVDPDGACTFP